MYMQNKLTDTENELVVTKGERETIREVRDGIKIYKLLCIKYMTSIYYVAQEIIDIFLQ